MASDVLRGGDDHGLPLVPNCFHTRFGIRTVCVFNFGIRTYRLGLGAAEWAAIGGISPRSLAFLQLRLDRQYGGFQRRKPILDNVPDERVRNAMVFVSKDIADPRDLRPRNLRLTRLKLQRNASRRLGHDLDAALDSMTPKPILPKLVQRPVSGRVLDPVDRL
jgi:hypothetical protein